MNTFRAAECMEGPASPYGFQDALAVGHTYVLLYHDPSEGSIRSTMSVGVGEGNRRSMSRTRQAPKPRTRSGSSSPRGRKWFAATRTSSAERRPPHRKKRSASGRKARGGKGRGPTHPVPRGSPGRQPRSNWMRLTARLTNSVPFLLDRTGDLRQRSLERH